MAATQPTTRKRRTVRPQSDKFIVGMVTESGKLYMAYEPNVFTSYDEALKSAEERYRSKLNCKFVVFAKAATVGAPFLAPKIEEYKF